jgi:hypothetical protein
VQQRQYLAGTCYPSPRGGFCESGKTAWAGKPKGLGWLYGATFVEKQDVGPSARSDVAMVFDAARNRVVLFGRAGAGTATPFNDTWEWDGENWTQYEDIGHVPRSRHAMACDSKRKVIDA